MVNKCLTSRRETIESSKTYNFVWISISLFFILVSINLFSKLREIEKLKSNRTKLICPECNYSGVSWDAKTCPNCGSSKVNLTPLGHSLIFFANLFFIYACAQVVFANYFPSKSATNQSTKTNGANSSGKILKSSIIRSDKNLEKIKAFIIEHYKNENFLVEKIDLKYIKSENEYQNISGTIDLLKEVGSKNILITLKCGAIVRIDNSFEWNCK